MEIMIGMAVVFLLLLAYSLCYSAGEADRRMEESVRERGGMSDGNWQYSSVVL